MTITWLFCASSTLRDAVFDAHSRGGDGGGAAAHTHRECQQNQPLPFAAVKGASVSTVSLSTVSLSTASLSTVSLSTVSLSMVSLSAASLSTASLSTASLRRCIRNLVNTRNKLPSRMTIIWLFFASSRLRDTERDYCRCRCLYPRRHCHCHLQCHKSWGSYVCLAVVRVPDVCFAGIYVETSRYSKITEAA